MRKFAVDKGIICDECIVPLWKRSFYVVDTSRALSLLEQNEAENRAIILRLCTQYWVLLGYLDKKSLGSSPTL